MSVATPEEAQPRAVPAESGVWVFIIGDIIAFALFFALILYYRMVDHAEFAASQAQLNKALGLTNTILLLFGSILVYIGVQAVRTANQFVARITFICAIVCGFAFISIKLTEYTQKLGAGITMYTNNFFLCYFTFTAVHLLHVVAGIAFLAVAIRRLPGGRGPMFVEGAGCFWHMVDLLWLILFPLFYLIG